MSKRKRSALLLGLAALLGGLAAADVAGREAALRRAVGAEVPVVVARTALPAGEPVKASSLGVRRVPRRYAPSGAYPSARLLEGVAPAVAIPAGADLVPAMVERGAVPLVGPGERVVDLVAVGSAELIAPGGRVDVLVTRDHADGRGETRVALRDAEVLTVRAGEDGKVAISLRSSLEKAVELTAAQSFAREVRVLPR